MCVAPVLDETAHGLGADRVLAAVPQRPRVCRIGAGDGMAQDNDEVAVGVEGLQKAHAQQRGGRLFERKGG